MIMDMNLCALGFMYTRRDTDKFQGEFIHYNNVEVKRKKQFSYLQCLSATVYPEFH